MIKLVPCGNLNSLTNHVCYRAWYIWFSKIHTWCKRWPDEYELPKCYDLGHWACWKFSNFP